MAFQPVPRRLYAARIYTSDLIFEGQLEPLGHLMDDLSDPAKSGFLLREAHIAPLIAGSGLRPFSLDQVTVNKSDFHLVYLSDAGDRESLSLMIRTEPAIVYTSRFVIRGHFHMGGETRLRDFADGLTSLFLAASDVSVFPLFQPAVDIPKSYPLVLINKHLITLYHPPMDAQATE